MRTLYIECNMGAAGDMLTAALFELLTKEEQEKFINKINATGLHDVSVDISKVVKCGITGTHVSVSVAGVEEDEHVHEHTHTHEHEHGHGEGYHHHQHSGMSDIEHVVKGHLDVSDKVKKDILAVYNIIAEAESLVHGKKVEEIHFHEVGNKDAIMDITAVCLLMEMLAPAKIIASPIHVGSGQVKCAHGILPVPAPATALILKDIPIYSGNINGELCTPTGAALLKYFVDEFANMPVMRIGSIGYGMGNKEFEIANCVRVMLGETSDDSSEMIVELSLNIDDMTGEEIGFAMETLMDTGALDVFTTSVGMKKSRPGVMLTVLCKEEDKGKIINSIFKHTTTLGIRQAQLKRYTLNRKMVEEKMPFGTVHKKVSEGYGVVRSKIEYEDLAKIAKENDESLIGLNRI